MTRTDATKRISEIIIADCQVLRLGLPPILTIGAIGMAFYALYSTCYVNLNKPDTPGWQEGVLNDIYWVGLTVLFLTGVAVAVHIFLLLWDKGLTRHSMSFAVELTIPSGTENHEVDYRHQFWLHTRLCRSHWDACPFCFMSAKLSKSASAMIAIVLLDYRKDVPTTAE